MTVSQETHLIQEICVPAENTMLIRVKYRFYVKKIGELVYGKENHVSYEGNISLLYCSSLLLSDAFRVLLNIHILYHSYVRSTKTL